MPKTSADCRPGRRPAGGAARRAYPPRRRQAKLAQARGHALLESARTMIAAEAIKRVEIRIRHGDLLEGTPIWRRTPSWWSSASAARRPTSPSSISARTSSAWCRPPPGRCSWRRAPTGRSSASLSRSTAAGAPTAPTDTAENRTRLDAPVRRLHEAGFDVEGRLLQGEPDNFIAVHVEAEGVGLLVMGAYGHSRIRSLVIGSTTESMVRRCKVPVLMFL